MLFFVTIYTFAAIRAREVGMAVSTESEKEDEEDYRKEE